MRLPHYRKTAGQAGASLIEFALILPLLLILLLGIVEFGWLLGQYNDVRHGTREGARYAAVNAGNTADVVSHVCSAMDGLDAGMESIDITLASGGGATGDTGTITVAATVSSLSGTPLITSFLPSELASTVEFRLEQDASWGGSGEC